MYFSSISAHAAAAKKTRDLRVCHRVLEMSERLRATSSYRVTLARGHLCALSNSILVLYFSRSHAQSARH